MKLYCNMHDLMINTSERKLSKVLDAELECPCCTRFVDPTFNHGFETPDPIMLGGVVYSTQEQDVCNCFFGTSHSGYYSKEEMEAHNRGSTYKDAEESDREDKEDELLERYNEQMLALP